MFSKRSQPLKTCDYRNNFLKFKSQIVDCKCKKQARKAQEILEKLKNTEIKSKIYYLSHIYKTVNMLNFEQPGKKFRLGYLRLADNCSTVNLA